MVRDGKEVRVNSILICLRETSISEERAIEAMALAVSVHV